MAYECATGPTRWPEGSVFPGDRVQLPDGT
jgi:hypothetical protein